MELAALAASVLADFAVACFEGWAVAAIATASRPSVMMPNRVRFMRHSFGSSRMAPVESYVRRR